jgi:6,7-dimethyl-8-ribityllumazine synthase
MRICFIQATWHKEIVDQLKDAFVAEIGRLSSGAPDIEFVEVPGSLELPLQAKLFAKSGRYDAIVVAGLIVDGGIYRHEFVAQAVLEGIMAAQLQTETPILSAVLTPQDFSSSERERFFHEHFRIKGRETAAACVGVLHNMSMHPRRAEATAASA